MPFKICRFCSKSLPRLDGQKTARCSGSQNLAHGKFGFHFFIRKKTNLKKIFGILLPKLSSPSERKNCFSDREKLLKFEAEGREFEFFLRSLEQFIQTVKGQNNFW